MNTDHELLLQDWSKLDHHKDKCFIKDGIIDINRWKIAKKKILFILKEGYDNEKKGGMDLRDLFKGWKKPHGPTGRGMADWAYLLHHSAKNNIKPFPNKKENAKVIDSFLHCAVINVKKSDGKTQSDRDNLQDYIENDSKYLKKQIELISPEIIICGNVPNLLKSIWNNPIEVSDLVYKIDNMFVVNFWHPSNRYPRKLNYYALASLASGAGIL